MANPKSTPIRPARRKAGTVTAKPKPPLAGLRKRRAELGQHDGRCCDDCEHGVGAERIRIIMDRDRSRPYGAAKAGTKPGGGAKPRAGRCPTTRPGGGADAPSVAVSCEPKASIPSRQRTRIGDHTPEIPRQSRDRAPPMRQPGRAPSSRQRPASLPHAVSCTGVGVADRADSGCIIM
jgi:hypothetical protein